LLVLRQREQGPDFHAPSYWEIGATPALSQIAEQAERTRKPHGLRPRKLIREVTTNAQARSNNSASHRAQHHDAHAYCFGIVDTCERLTLCTAVQVQRGNLSRAHYCNWNCETELWSTANLWDSTRNKPRSCPSLLQACIATCVAAKRAAQQ
jgi:hypothetical protein